MNIQRKTMCEEITNQSVKLILEDAMKGEKTKVEAPFHQHTGLQLQDENSKCYIWSIALHGAETSTLRKVAQKYLKSLPHGAGKG